MKLNNLLDIYEDEKFPNVKSEIVLDVKKKNTCTYMPISIVISFLN